MNCWYEALEVLTTTQDMVLVWADLQNYMLRPYCLRHCILGCKTQGIQAEIWGLLPDRCAENK